MRVSSTASVSQPPATSIVLTQFYWERYSDDRLLKVRLKDLGVTIQGTWLEGCVAQLYDELEARAITEQAMRIAAEICIYTNSLITIEEL